MSLWALLRPSLTPVRSLTVTGISPSALFIPTTIFPSRPAASSTGDSSILIFWLGNDEGLTRGTAARLVNEIDGAAAVEVDEVEVACAFASDDLRSRDEQLRLAARDLHTEDALGGVSPDEGPFFLRPLQEGHRETHYGRY